MEVCVFAVVGVMNISYILFVTYAYAIIS